MDMESEVSHVYGLETDLGTLITSVTPELEARLGHTPGALVNAPLGTVVDLADLPVVRNALDRLVVASHEFITEQVSLRCFDGTTAPCLFTAAPMSLDDTTSSSGFTVLIEFGDLPESPGANGDLSLLPPPPSPTASAPDASTRMLMANEALFRSLAETSPVAVARLRPDRRIDYTNPKWRQLTGQRSTAVGLTLVDMVNPDHRADVLGELEARIASGSDEPIRLQLSHVPELDGPDGDAHWVHMRVQSVVDNDRGVVGYVAVLEDITDLVRTQESQLDANSKLAYQATHDPLTGLPNRSLLIDHMQLALARSQRDHTPVALLFMDIDKFKFVNDTYGHDSGDALLKELAARVGSVLRPSDTVARLGGDEFVVLAEDIEGERDALRIAERVREAIEGTPFTFAGNDVTITTSIGIAISNGGGSEPAALLRDADTAMYRAKQGGRARTELFDEVLRERTERRDRLTAELATALENDSLVAHFHPMVDLRTGLVVGAEALARWPRPDGIMAARDFIDIAKDAGLSTAVDSAVVRHAFRQAQRWHADLGSSSPVLHINASRHSIELDEMANVLQELLSNRALPATKLCLEVSESMLNDTSGALLDSMQRLRTLGLRIAVDGVGASALPLSELARYPIDMLKIAPQLIGQTVDPAARQVVKGIVALARTMQLHVGAEGVDQAPLVGLVGQLGLDAGQGKAFSVPVPAHEFEAIGRRVFEVR